MLLSRDRYHAIVDLLQALLIKPAWCDSMVVEQQLPGSNLRPDIEASVCGTT